MKKHIKITPEVIEIKNKLRGHGLHTVCEEAKCPNLCECFSKGTATFMILGDICTRNCAFCGIKSMVSRPESPSFSHTGREILQPPSKDEPCAIAKMAAELKLRHVVITSVTRDDLRDEGTGQFAATINAIRDISVIPMTIEVLTPDFHAREDLLREVCAAGPDIYNHNIETVRRLSREVRPQAGYDRSLNVLKWVRRNFPEIIVKSGIIAGLGEGEAEVIETLKDLQTAGCNLVTIGQYFAPGKTNRPVAEYLSDEQFERYKRAGEEMGIEHVMSGRYVRSSYMAEKMLDQKKPTQGRGM